MEEIGHWLSNAPQHNPITPLRQTNRIALAIQGLQARAGSAMWSARRA